jgi:hypothetical protein
VGIVPRADHEHRHPCREQSLDHRPVAALDPHPAHPATAEAAHRLTQTGRGMGDLEALEHRLVIVMHAYRVLIPRPVRSGHRRTCRDLSNVRAVQLRPPLLAPVGEAAAVRDVQPVAH